MTRDFLCRSLCALMWMTQGPMILVFLRAMLTPADSSPRRRGLMYLWLAHNIITSPLHYFVKNSLVLMIQNLSVLGLICYIAIRCYSDRTYKKVLAVVLIMVTPVLADLMTSTLHLMLLGEPASYGLLEQMDFDFVILSASTLIIGVVLQGLACLFWRRVVRQRRTVSYAAYMVVFLILGIGIFLAGVWGAPAADTVEGSIYFVVYMCTFLVICGSVFVLASQMEKDDIARELEEMHRFSQLERIHYTAIEARREEMAHIRHDYNNVLTSVMHLLHTGAYQEAAGLLSELSQRISATQETLFCPIPVVNAVLAEKQRQCTNRGIQLQPQLQLPEQLPLSNLDLFSAFNGLLDLAMELYDPKSELGISLSCRVIRGYLVIKCTFPLRGKAAGQPKMLKALATRCHGDFFTEQKAGRCTAQLSLRAEP